MTCPFDFLLLQRWTFH